MAELEIQQIPCLADNYGYLVHDPETGATASVDTPEVAPILRALDERGWTLTHILNTHHHYDHAGGNLEIKQKTGCTVVGSRGESAKIPGIDREVGDGDTVELGSHRARVIDVPGHTIGHVAYAFEDDGVAFVGDSLFALGCGRVFEGTPAQMWDSLSKLMKLAPETRIYCAHEYTQANARFALSVDPHNSDLLARSAEIDRLRSAGTPTVPTTLELELRTNPFLRPDSPDLQRALGMEGAAAADVFAETRKRKDDF